MLKQLKEKGKSGGGKREEERLEKEKCNGETGVDIKGKSLNLCTHRCHVCPLS